MNFSKVSPIAFGSCFKPIVEFQFKPIVEFWFRPPTQLLSHLSEGKLFHPQHFGDSTRGHKRQGFTMPSTQNNSSPVVQSHHNPAALDKQANQLEDKQENSDH